MSDLLMEISRNPNARKVVKALGLPLPLPEPLRREKGPAGRLPLRDRRVAYVAAGESALTSSVAEALCRGGANPVLEEGGPEAEFRRPGEAWGRLPTMLGSLSERDRLDGVVVDASMIVDVSALGFLRASVQPLLGRMARSGRIVVLGRPSSSVSGAAASMSQAALEGYVRSLAKETGRTGVTVNLVRVSEGAEDRLAGVLRFILSSRSAFVTGQPFDIDTSVSGSAGEPGERALEGKVALVTGAARGIGEQTARALAAEGAHVLCLDRPADDAAVAELAREIGGTAVLADLGDPDAPATVVAAVAARGGLDLVVHNAGITRDKTLARMKPEHWDSVLDINGAAILRLHDALLPHMRDGGRIVALSSIAGIAGNMGQTAYAASKAGVIGFVRAESARLASRGISVNAIAPGFIETRMTAAIPVAIREVARRLSALGQGGLPQDVAAAIVFLCTPDSVGIGGRVLRVCGGAFVGA